MRVHTYVQRVTKGNLIEIPMRKIHFKKIVHFSMHLESKTSNPLVYYQNSKKALFDRKNNENLPKDGVFTHMNTL